MTERVLNVLLLEDLKNDAELIKRQILKAAPKSIFTVARNRAEFFEKIEWSVPDVVLADYNLPDINGLEALLYIREKKPLVPFVFVSGMLNNEEKVADTVLKGASGYVLKENLSVLPDKLVAILNQSDSLRAAALEKERIQRSSQLALQKAASILRQAPEFEGKETVAKLLDEALSGV